MSDVIQSLRRAYGSGGKSYRYRKRRMRGSRRRGRSGIYRRRNIRNKAPFVRGTWHKTESVVNWTGTTALGAPNNCRLLCSAWDTYTPSGGRWLDQGTFTSVSIFTDKDTYFQSGTANWPIGIRKFYWLKQINRIQMKWTTNQDTRVRITMAKFRKANTGPMLEDWNSDVTRVQNTRHYKIYKQKTFVLTASDFTTDATSTAARRQQEKVVYFNLHPRKWMFTNTGDPSTASSDWFDNNYVRDAVFLRIDTNDSNLADGSIEFQVIRTDLWCSVETTQT